MTLITRQSVVNFSFCTVNYNFYIIHSFDKKITKCWQQWQQTKFIPISTFHNKLGDFISTKLVIMHLCDSFTNLLTIY